jgi:hypothetical protein
LDVREHFRDVDPHSPVTPEEMRKLTKLALQLVPVCVKLEEYVKALRCWPGLN